MIFRRPIFFSVNAENYTNVQLCSSQVDKGKSDNLSGNFLVENFLGENFFELKFFGWIFFWVKIVFGENFLSEIFFGRLGLHEASGFRKYSTLLVIQLFSPRLCLCHCLCIRLCLCICVPYSFLISYYHKLSENVWVWRSGASGSWDVTIAGWTNDRTRKDRATQPIDHGRLRWAILKETLGYGLSPFSAFFGAFWDFLGFPHIVLVS